MKPILNSGMSQAINVVSKNLTAAREKQPDILLSELDFLITYTFFREGTPDVTQISDLMIPARAGQSAARLYSQTPEIPSKFIVYIHGGG